MSEKKRIAGYAAGIISGASYGMNPLFAKPLMTGGISINSMLFFRYAIAVLMMGSLMIYKKESFKLTVKQAEWLVILGILFSCSSIFLFSSYNFIPSGLATVLIYLYPIFTAIIMIFFKQMPSGKVWLSIIASVCGVAVLCMPSGNFSINFHGFLLAMLSAFAYTLYIVIINKVKEISNISANTITFYVLTFGSIMFLIYRSGDENSLFNGLNEARNWINLSGLALFPTMISLITLAISTKLIGATKTSVLGVFEPVTAIAVGALLFREPVTVNVIMGIFICIAAVIFMIKTSEN